MVAVLALLTVELLVLFLVPPFHGISHVRSYIVTHPESPYGFPVAYGSALVLQLAAIALLRSKRYCWMAGFAGLLSVTLFMSTQDPTRSQIPSHEYLLVGLLSLLSPDSFASGLAIVLPVTLSAIVTVLSLRRAFSEASRDGDS